MTAKPSHEVTVFLEKGDITFFVRAAQRDGEDLSNEDIWHMFEEMYPSASTVSVQEISDADQEAEVQEILSDQDIQKHWPDVITPEGRSDIRRQLAAILEEGKTDAGS
jgi:hypothetical protein